MGKTNLNAAGDLVYGGTLVNETTTNLEGDLRTIGGNNTELGMGSTYLGEGVNTGQQVGADNVTGIKTGADYVTGIKTGGDYNSGFNLQNSSVQTESLGANTYNILKDAFNVVQENARKFMELASNEDLQTSGATAGFSLSNPTMPFQPAGSGEGGGGISPLPRIWKSTGFILAVALILAVFVFKPKRRKK